MSKDETNEVSFWDTVYLDAVAAGYSVKTRPSFLTLLSATRRLMRMRPGFACVFWLRVNQLFARKGWRGHYRLKIWRYYRFASDISELAEIGPGLLLPHPMDVTIGSKAKIGRNGTIYNGVTLGSRRSGERDGGMPHLGDNVIVYTGAKLIGPVRVGDNSCIGACALCLKDVPADSVMYGIPPNITVKPNKGKFD